MLPVRARRRVDRPRRAVCLRAGRGGVEVERGAADVKGGAGFLVRTMELREVSLPLVRPFRTSFGEEREKRAILVRVVLSTDGGEVEGWGECVASSDPLYSEEWLEGSWLVLVKYLGPALLGVGVGPFEDPSGIEQRMHAIRGHPMAKAALVAAVLDAWLRAREQSLSGLL